MDVLIVKSRFSPVESGLYAAVATVGKITLWVPGALIAFLIPKAAAQYAQGKKPVALLRGTQLSALALCGVISIVFFEWATYVMHLLYGSQYMASAILLGPYGLVMAMYALVGIWYNYYLAVGEMRYTWVLISAIIFQAAILVSLCQTTYQMVGAMFVSGVGLVVCGEGMYHWLPSKSSARSTSI
jgi:O-antigen/teichoic acid export membrane protein